MSKGPRLRAAIRNHLRDERGTVTVDWAMLAAAATGLGLSGLVVMTNHTDWLQGIVTTTLLDEVRDIRVVNADGTVTVVQNGSTDIGTPLSDAWANVQAGQDEDAEEVEVFELAFAGRSTEVSTSVANVTCGSILATGCGQSSEIITESFLMNDGTVWRRRTRTYETDQSAAVTWYDGTGHEIRDVPLLPDDLPDIVIQ